MVRRGKFLLFPISFSLIFWGLVFISFITGTFLWLCLLLIHIDLFTTHFIPKYLRIIKHKAQHNYKWVQWAWAFTIAWIIFKLVGTYFIEFYSIPSQSMNSALRKGDVVLVNKTILGSRQSPDYLDRYHRNGTFSKIQHNDLIVFNFPEGDTILEKKSNESYYTLKRKYSSKQIENNQKSWGHKIHQGISDRSPFIKRVIGMPGDTITIQSGKPYINNTAFNTPNTFVYKYSVTNNTIASKHSPIAINRYKEKRKIIWEISDKEIEANPSLTADLQPIIMEKNLPDQNTFPFEDSYLWNYDNMGPLVIPRKGSTVTITLSNLPIYDRVIRNYENNKIDIINQTIYINNSECKQYTFKQDYYWVQGDNTPNSYDSRFWGFVPQNHIIGVATHIIMSIDYNQPFFTRLRSNRFFKKMNKKTIQTQ